jgi:hypothetical protein
MIAITWFALVGLVAGSQPAASSAASKPGVVAVLS